MGVASMVLGIIFLILGWIPGFSYVAAIVSLLGLILGIVDTVQKSRQNMPKGMAVAGIVLCTISLIISGWMSISTSLFVNKYTSLF